MACIWLIELVRMLSSDTSISETSRILSISSAYSLFSISYTKLLSDSNPQFLTKDPIISKIVLLFLATRFIRS